MTDRGLSQTRRRGNGADFSAAERKTGSIGDRKRCLSPLAGQSQNPGDLAFGRRGRGCRESETGAGGGADGERRCDGERVASERQPLRWVDASVGAAGDGLGEFAVEQRIDRPNLNSGAAIGFDQFGEHDGGGGAESGGRCDGFLGDLARVPVICCYAAARIVFRKWATRSHAQLSPGNGP